MIVLLCCVVLFCIRWFVNLRWVSVAKVIWILWVMNLVIWSGLIFCVMIVLRCWWVNLFWVMVICIICVVDDLIWSIWIICVISILTRSTRRWIRLLVFLSILCLVISICCVRVMWIKLLCLSVVIWCLCLIGIRRSRLAIIVSDVRKRRIISSCWVWIILNLVVILICGCIWCLNLLLKIMFLMVVWFCFWCICFRVSSSCTFRSIWRIRFSVSRFRFKVVEMF